MISAEDRAALHDPDEFGVEAVLHEPGRAPAHISGMWGRPLGANEIRRSQTSTSASSTRVAAGASVLQLFNEDMPLDWRNTRVVVDEREYSIAQYDPIDRLRTACVLIAWGDREARQVGSEASGRGQWISPQR